MDTLTLTIILAFIIVLLAILALSIGWLLTGKSKIQGGSCGRAPRTNKNKDCGINYSCDICEKPKEPNTTKKRS